MASPGGGSSFSDSSFLPEEYILKTKLNWAGICVSFMLIKADLFNYLIFIAIFFIISNLWINSGGLNLKRNL